VAHRLVTLRAPGRSGIPFGFLRTNPAGFITKRFPLPGLALPRHGHGCPLWAIYAAAQSPGRTLRQLVQFPDNARFMFVARSVVKATARFQAPPVVHVILLACEAIHADSMVYADGMVLDRGASPVPVGPSCHLCPRHDCLHRAEEQIIGSSP
jgi:XRE family transcriptional regulator, fatty acid utilization regulator